MHNPEKTAGFQDCSADLPLHMSSKTVRASGEWSGKGSHKQRIKKPSTCACVLEKWAWQRLLENGVHLVFA